MKNILTIAGFDPSSGAGITRDLDVFFSMGLHGFAVPTCIVNQGPGGVVSLYPIPLDYFSQMLETIADRVRIDGIKIGAMYDGSHVEVLSQFISSHMVASGFSRQKKGIPVVVDPIVSAKNNTPLLTVEGLKKLVARLFPFTTILTPNIDEASAITGNSIESIDDMKKSARATLGMGPKAVVIKGGHLKGNPIDLLYDGEEYFTWDKKRINRKIHGTGCSFSSVLLAFLIYGNNLKGAFVKAEQYMQNLLSRSYKIADKGYYYTSSAIVASGVMHNNV